MKDFIVGVVMTAFAATALLWLIPTQVAPGYGGGAALSPRFWPTVIAVVILLLGAVLSAQALLRLRRKASARETRTETAATPATAPESSPWAVWTAVFMLVPYYYLSLQLGLLLSSVLAYVAYSTLAGERNVTSILAFAIAGPLVLTLFFIIVAQVLIPLGPLSSIY